MQRIILLLISQLVLLQGVLSQVDHVKEYWNDTWQKYHDAKKEIERRDKEVKAIAARVSSLEKNAEKDLNEINSLNKIQDGLLKKLRKAQEDYSSVCLELREKNDSIKTFIAKNKDLTTKNKDLTRWVDSFSVALKEEKVFNEKLMNEKKQLEQQLYFKDLDLQISEIDNSYFSTFDLGYKRLLNDEVFYLENSKEQSAKPILTSLEYIRFTGSIYTPAHIDTLRGFILIYKDGKLYDQVPECFFAESIRRNYCYYDIEEYDIKLNKKVKPRSNIKIAFVTDEVFHRNIEKLEDFKESLRSGYFVISSTRPEANYSTGNEPGGGVRIGNEVFAEQDSITTIADNVIISVVNNLDFNSEYVALMINESIIEKNIKLMPFDHKISFNYNLREGWNSIKIKVLSVNPKKTHCHVWLYIEMSDGSEYVYNKPWVLEKDDVFVLYIKSNTKYY